MLQTVTASDSRFPENVLDPVDRGDFFDNYWESKPLHISRSDKTNFSALLSIADIETVLSTHDIGFPVVQMTRADHPLPAGNYTDSDNKIVLSRLLRCHQDGATLIVSQAQNYFPALRELCTDIQAALQLRCQANFYLSPPGRQGFNPHFDSHDVFILQVSGKKTFRFYSGGVELPFSENAFESEQGSIGDLTEEIQLASGDTLYIPRGMVHDAVADDSEPSLHITVGLYAVTLRSVLQEVLQIASEHDADYRKSIDHRLWLQPDGSNQSSIDHIEKLLSAAFSEVNLQQALSRLRDDSALNCRESLSGLLSAKGACAEFTGQTLIVVRENSIIGTERVEQKLLVRVAGRVMHFEDPMIEPVEWLLSVGSALVGDIAGLELPQQIALATRLSQENIVTVDAVNPN